MIKKPFIRRALLIAAIRRPFQDAVAFSATSVKRINEAVYMGGHVITEDIPDYAWEAFSEELEVEKEELIE